MTLNTQTRPLDFTPAQLKLIRRSVARLCTPVEFDEFMAVAAQCGLDPLRRQITPLIVATDDPDRRRLIPWTTIDGLRVIAARHKDYRPMEEAPIIEYDQARVHEETNPLGIVRAEVRAWKASDGVWHAVVGEAWWDEFAPMRRSGATAKGGEVGRRSSPDAEAIASVAELTLDPAWRRMGRVMIVKCAEAQALRRGWPDLLSGLYGEEELHVARLAENTASDLLQKARDDERRERAAKRTLWFVAKPGDSFAPVFVSEIENFVRDFYLAANSAADIKRFDDDNRASLATYWEWMPREAFRLKSMSEALQSARSNKHWNGSHAGETIVAGDADGDEVEPAAVEVFRGGEHEQ